MLSKVLVVSAILFGTLVEGSNIHIKQDSQIEDFLQAKEFKQKELPYPLDGLKPIISEKTMGLHYGKHHAGYVKNLNKSIQDMEVALKDQNIEKIIDLTQKIKFNGGGHINHELFWESMLPISQGGGNPPTENGPVDMMIKKEYGSLKNLKDKFSAVATAVQGSGWGYLLLNTDTNTLEIRAS